MEKIENSQWTINATQIINGMKKTERGVDGNAPRRPRTPRRMQMLC
jgi:hypothetical protein